MSSHQSIAGCFLRVTWFLIGPALALVTLLFVYLHGGGWLGPADIVYTACVFGCLAARWFDDPGEQPSREAYVIAVSSAAAALWLIVHLIRS